MEKNFYSYKKPKWVLTTLLTLFCCLFANMAMVQDSFNWNGCSFKNCATAGNWTKTGIAGIDTLPGQTSGQQLDLNELSRVTNFYLCNKFQIKYN